MALKKDKGALRKHYSAMNEDTRGDQVSQTGHDVGPSLPMVPDNGQFQQGADLASIASPAKGASLSQRGPRGAAPSMPGSSPLTGHSAGNFAGVGAEASGPTILSGNHTPVRGSGNPTKVNDLSAGEKD